jgi:hypothetical protein
MARVTDAYARLATADGRAAYVRVREVAAAVEAAAAAGAAAAPPAGDEGLPCGCGKTHRLRLVRSNPPLASCAEHGWHDPVPGDVFCEWVEAPAGGGGGRRRRRRAVYLVAGGGVLYDITAAAECGDSRLAGAGGIRPGECVVEKRG